MENRMPDNVVYSKEKGYNASFLPYATNLGAPAIKLDDIGVWKNYAVTKLNKEFETKFKEIKLKYQSLMEEFEWNELIYNSNFSFEPIIGQIYYLYRADNGSYFLSLITPQEWNKEHVGTFELNSDKKWVKQN